MILCLLVLYVILYPFYIFFEDSLPRSGLQEEIDLIILRSMADSDYVSFDGFLKAVSSPLEQLDQWPPPQQPSHLCSTAA